MVISKWLTHSLSISAINKRSLKRYVKRFYPVLLLLILLNLVIFSFVSYGNANFESDDVPNAVMVDVLDPQHSYRGNNVVNIDPDIELIENNKVIPLRKITANEPAPIPLVTMFTTMKFNSEREIINMNTLKLWASMKPWAKIVLFTTPNDDPTWAAKAEELGWHVYPAPKLRLGVPVLTEMFNFILDEIPLTPFIGYANSDILFTAELNRTLQALHNAPWKKYNGSSVLLTGRRTDALATKAAEYNSVSEIKLERLLAPGTVPSSGYSLDYFITMTQDRNVYPWHRVPEFVVGKPGYDNWLVIKALDWKSTLIDLTLTVPALHQMLDYENKDSGWFAKNVCMNRELFDPFSVVRGNSDCAPYFTKNHVSGAIAIYKTINTKFDCMPEVPVWGSPRHITCVDIVKKLKRKEKEKLEKEKAAKL